MKIRRTGRTSRRAFTGRRTVPTDKFKITKCRTHNAFLIAAACILGILVTAIILAIV